MWQLSNHTPYAAERNWIRDKQGAHRWIVAVKATFAIPLRGPLVLADEQRPPTFAPEYHGADGASSLRHDADLGPLKPTTDVWQVSKRSQQARRIRDIQHKLISPAKNPRAKLDGAMSDAEKSADKYLDRGFDVEVVPL